MMKRLFTWEFWDAALARATRTAAQAVVTAMAGCAVLNEVNWTLIGSTIGVMVLSSFATSVLFALPEVNE